MPFSTPAQIQYLSASAIYNTRTPFLVDQPLLATSLAGATLYGAKHPGTLSTAKYAKISGVTGTTLTMPTALGALDQTVAASLAGAPYLLLALVKNGTLLVRVGQDGTPATGQFKAATPTTITLGDAAIVSDVFEVFALVSADVVTITGGAMTAGRDYQIAAYTFMYTAGNVSVDKLMR